MKIKIRKSPTADTRTAKEPVSKGMLLKSSYQHIMDVGAAMEWITVKLLDIAAKHDYSKVDAAGIEQFHADFSETQQTGADFTKMKWYQRHIAEERHHLNNRVPDDVNLFDVLERIADITTAGMARSGSVYSDTLSPEVLLKAYQNTIKLIVENIEVVE